MEAIYKTSRGHIVRSGYVVFSCFLAGDRYGIAHRDRAALKKVAKEHGRLVTARLAPAEQGPEFVLRQRRRESSPP